MPGDDDNASDATAAAMKDALDRIVALEKGMREKDDIMQGMAEELDSAKNQAHAASKASTVATAQAKLPPFWPDKSEFWFAQAESQFHIKDITREVTKYHHVVAMLDTKSADLVYDIIRVPPREQDQPYTKLKARLTGALTLSNDERADRLLDMNGLGDRTPSQALQDMFKLVPDGLEDPGFLFRRLFLRLLSPEVQAHLAQTAHTGTTPAQLRDLAKEADKYYRSTGARISAVSGSNLDEEELEVDAINGRQWCFYHRVFGPKATRCKKTQGERCDWTKASEKFWKKPPNRKSGNGQGRA